MYDSIGVFIRNVVAILGSVGGLDVVEVFDLSFSLFMT